MNNHIQDALNELQDVRDHLDNVAASLLNAERDKQRSRAIWLYEQVGKLMEEVRSEPQ